MRALSAIVGFGNVVADQLHYPAHNAGEVHWPEDFHNWSRASFFTAMATALLQSFVISRWSMPTWSSLLTGQQMSTTGLKRAVKNHWPHQSFCSTLAVSQHHPPSIVTGPQRNAGRYLETTFRVSSVNHVDATEIRGRCAYFALVTRNALASQQHHS